VSKQYPVNSAALIHAKLLDKAQEIGIDVNILRMRYAIERFLYRLSLSEYKDKFTLKGAMLFILWSNDNFRPTKDSDFLLTGELYENVITSLTPYFYNDVNKNIQWKAFLRKSRVKHSDLSLKQACLDIKNQLCEVFDLIEDKT